MNDALKMQISAFIDGELPDNESELLLRRLSQDVALRQKVAQYLEIGRLIRRENEIPGMSELRDRIGADLGEDPLQHTASAGVSASKFTRPAIGVAVAVSVAVVALLAIRQAYLPSDVAAPDEQFVGRSVPDSQSAGRQPDDELLKQLYLRHNPRLVTWQLEDGALVDIEAADDALDEDGQDDDGQ